MECRVRAAIFGHAPGEGRRNVASPADTVEALNALGHVMSELLAHHSDECTSEFLGKVFALRQGWLKHPRVAIQNTVGNA
jgi:hypothetical protein